MYVDGDLALSHDAYWSCVTRISQDVAMFPVDVVRYVGDARQPVAPAPQIIAAPSVFAQPLDWRLQVVMSWLTTGTAYGLVTEVDRETLLPSRIELQRGGDVVPVQNGDDVRFMVNGVEHKMWPAGRLWVEPGITMPGRLLGLSPLAYHAATVGRGLAAAKFGSDFFTDGAHPTGLLLAKDNPGDEGAKQLKQKFMGILRGNREPVVLPAGIEYKQIQTDPTDSQFLDTMRYSVEQICRVFGEDPADYGSSAGGTAMTYANRIDADLARMKRRQFWVTKIQDVLTRLVPEGMAVRLSTDASLMMTPKEKHEVFKLRLDAKTMTVNEVRELSDDPKFGPEYDEPGIPQALAPDPLRSLAAVLAERATPLPVQPVERSTDTHIHLPESLAVEMRQDDELRAAVRALGERAVTVDDLAAVVGALQGLTIPAPVVNVAAPVVNVEPPAVVVDVQAPVVNIAPQPVQLTLLKPEDDTQHTKTVKLKVGDRTVTGTITES